MFKKVSIYLMVAEPASLPKWDENDTNTLPITTEQQDDGFVLKSRPASGTFNAWMRNVYKWTEWFQEKFTDIDSDIAKLAPVDSIADLRAITYTPADGLKTNVLGYYTPGDGGGNEFYWDDVSVEADDGSRVIKVTAIAIGRFKADSSGINDLKKWGCKGDYVTDDTARRDAAMLDCKVNRRALYAPAGGYRFSTPLDSPTDGNLETYAIYGDGATLTAFMFESTNGVSMLGSEMSIRELSIFNRDAYTVPPTSYPNNMLPDRTLIASGTIGLQISKNNINAKNIIIKGFDHGVETNNVKFYSTLMQVRANFNLIGIYVDTNFTRSYGSQYLLNFENNVYINSGQHTFHDCSLEGCDDYDVNNLNFPNGGIYISKGSSGFFDNCWMEDLNFFNFGEATVNKVKGIYPMISMSPHFKVSETTAGYESKNLCLAPHQSVWGNDSIIDKSDNYMEEGHLYSIVTANGGAGVPKDIKSAFNPDVRGMLPLNVENSQFIVSFGVWIKLQTSNFDANAYPFVQIIFKDSAGTEFQADTPTRTQIFDPDAFDNTNTTDWQYIGSLRPARWTFATGLPIVGVRMRVALGEDSEDFSADQRILWISEPNIRFVNTEGGQQVDNSSRSQGIVTTQTLTLLAGVVNIPYTEKPIVYYNIDTQASAATDDFIAIVSPQLNPGTIIVLSAVDSARTVVCKDESANLIMNGDFSLDNTKDTIIFVWDGTNAKEMSRSSNGA